jgi:glycosyltransferase involved in cell wall biosynthesis
MKILIQVGNLGSSVIDHLMSPISNVGNVQKVLVYCHHPGLNIPKVEYRCPPKFLTNFAPAAVFYEFIDLLFESALRGGTVLAGYKLFPHGLIAVIAAKITRKPVIISIISGPVDLYSFGDPIGVDYGKSLPRKGKLLLAILKLSDTVITTGSFTKAFLIKNGIQESKIFPIIHPVNKSRFQRLEIRKSYEVVSVGRLIPLKHYEVIVRAISKVKAKYPHIKACFVGDGLCKAELHQLVNNLGLEENIEFAGWQKDPSQFYNKARILIHASEREGFPNVVLEAMTCGIPCIVSNCGDITDIVKDGCNSLVVQKFDDSEGFAIAITRLLEDKELYYRLSQNALKTMESNSSVEVTRTWETILARYI